MFINTREAVPYQMPLVEIGNPQLQTPMQTDNSAAHSVVTINVQPQKTKATDMRFHWLRCRDAQGQFRYYWRLGTANFGSYWTKHHPSVHHKSMQSTVLEPMNEVIALREGKLTQPMCHLQKLKRYLAESKILVRAMKLSSPTPREC